MEIEITDFKFRKFAIILDNVFTKDECDSLIELSEKNPKNYENVPNHYHQKPNKGWVCVDKKLADTFFDKMKSFIPIDYKGLPVIGLNERLSFLKYSRGEYNPYSENGIYDEDLDNSILSSKVKYLIALIYLNDLKEEDGGATFFYKDTENGVYKDYCVIPKVGRVLLFEDYFNHEGSILYNGLKYCIHTYIMYGSFTKEEDFKEEKINENNKYCIYYTNTSKTEASYIEFTTYCNGEEYIYKRDFRETGNQCPNCGSLILCCSKSHCDNHVKQCYKCLKYLDGYNSYEGDNNFDEIYLDCCEYC
jgi:hypothetical protein